MKGGKWCPWWHFHNHQPHLWMEKRGWKLVSRYIYYLSCSPDPKTNYQTTNPNFHVWSNLIGCKIRENSWKFYIRSFRIGCWIRWAKFKYIMSKINAIVHSFKVEVNCDCVDVSIYTKNCPIFFGSAFPSVCIGRNFTTYHCMKQIYKWNEMKINEMAKHPKYVSTVKRLD